MAWSLEEVAFFDLADLVREAVDSQAFLSIRGDEEPFLLSLPGRFEGEPGYHLFALAGDGADRIGFVALLPHWEQDALAIGPLYVRERDRGRGYGTRLVEGVVQWARTHGVQRLYAQTWGQNVRARRLLEGLGFLCVAEEPDTRVDGDSTLYYLLDLRRLGVH